MLRMPLPEKVKTLVEHLASISLVEWTWSFGILAVIVLLGILAGRLLARAVQRFARGTDTSLDDVLVESLGPPIRWLLPVFAMRVALPVLPLPKVTVSAFGHTCTLAILLLCGWAALRGVGVVESVISHRFDVSVPDNLRARSVQTQVRGFRNIARFVIGVITLALMLTTFDPVRRLGVSLLASAGVAGVVIGFAAQRSIATVVAGIQIAISQPIRIDDVVIVEGEWGRIEEITLTYVVVKVWDERRLVIPITQFIEKPFQNWTRTSAELLGTVYLYVDYGIPLEPLRDELSRLVEDDKEWDRRVAELVVTDAKEHTLELRALVSASDASKLWNLRCRVREGLIAFIQQTYPQHLPNVRAQVSTSDAATVKGLSSTA